MQLDTQWKVQKKCFNLRYRTHINASNPLCFVLSLLISNITLSLYNLMGIQVSTLPKIRPLLIKESHDMYQTNNHYIRKCIATRAWIHLSTLLSQLDSSVLVLYCKYLLVVITLIYLHLILHPRMFTEFYRVRSCCFKVVLQLTVRYT